MFFLLNFEKKHSYVIFFENEKIPFRSFFLMTPNFSKRIFFYKKKSYEQKNHTILLFEVLIKPAHIQ